jgi:methionyl aminopeptidase
MINIYSEKEIKIIQEGGKILAEIIEKLKNKVEPGIITEYLNKVAEDLILTHGAKPSFKGFNNFPKSLCVSINEEVVHGVPSNREIKQGDIVSLDLGIRYKGYCTDMAITVAIGEVNKKIKKLIGVTKDVLDIGTEQCKPGNYLRDIGSAIQKYVEKNGFNVVRELVGHGVGKKVHEEPQVLNYGEGPRGPELKEGMVLALEPMVTTGGWHVEKTKDRFGYKTTDNSLSAHFEHTIAITKKGPAVLTK